MGGIYHVYVGYQTEKFTLPVLPLAVPVRGYRLGTVQLFLLIHCVPFFCQFTLRTFDVPCIADTMLLLFR